MLNAYANQYELNIEIPFAGVGNNFTWTIPIDINSGVGVFDPSAPPPLEMELPP
jgi:hypothetical protein